MAITRAELDFIKLREAHVAEMMSIELEAYPEPWTERMFRDEIDTARSRFYVVCCDGVLIGYGGFWLVLDEAHITSVTIAKEWRNLGYGQQLLEFLLRVAREAGSRVATLEVRESNQSARNLYAKMGFRQVGVRKRYYPKSGEDALVMLADL